MSVPALQELYRGRTGSNAHPSSHAAAGRVRSLRHLSLLIPQRGLRWVSSGKVTPVGWLTLTN